MRRLASAGMAALLAACAPQATPSDIRLTSATLRAAAPGATTTVAYVALANRGGSDDRLVGAAMSGAGSASLHTSSITGGVMRMRPLADLPISAGGEVAMTQGSGAHIMVEGLTVPLREGDRATLTLRFAHAKPIRTTLTATAVASAMGGM